MILQVAVGLLIPHLGNQEFRWASRQAHSKALQQVGLSASVAFSCMKVAGSWASNITTLKFIHVISTLGNAFFLSQR